VKVRGLAAIDQRTVAARHLLDWRRDLLNDLGGDAGISAAQGALVDVAIRTRLYLDHVDAFFMLIARDATRTTVAREIVLSEHHQQLGAKLTRARLGTARPWPARSKSRQVDGPRGHARDHRSTASRASP
jgi:hypothetical protein